MRNNISKENVAFLERHNRDIGVDLTKVPTSSSQLFVGDVITFNYYGDGYNGASRLALVVQPVAKVASTGNRLLTVVNIPPSITLTPEIVNELYSNRGSLDAEGYRTFILNNKVRNILRVEPLSRMLEEYFEELEEGLR